MPAKTLCEPGSARLANSQRRCRRWVPGARARGEHTSFAHRFEGVLEGFEMFLEVLKGFRGVLEGFRGVLDGFRGVLEGFRAF